MCLVLFTFYPSTSSTTTSARADSSILERHKLLFGHKNKYATEILHCDNVTMQSHVLILRQVGTIFKFFEREAENKKQTNEQTKA